MFSDMKEPDMNAEELFYEYLKGSYGSFLNGNDPLEESLALTFGEEEEKNSIKIQAKTVSLPLAITQTILYFINNTLD